MFLRDFFGKMRKTNDFPKGLQFNSTIHVFRSNASCLAWNWGEPNQLYLIGRNEIYKDLLLVSDDVIDEVLALKNFDLKRSVLFASRFVRGRLYLNQFIISEIHFLPLIAYSLYVCTCT